MAYLVLKRSGTTSAKIKPAKKQNYENSISLIIIRIVLRKFKKIPTTLDADRVFYK